MEEFIEAVGSAIKATRNQIVCPSCQASLTTAVCAEFEPSKMIMRLDYAEGHKPFLRNIGRTLEAFGEAIRLSGKDMGIPVVALLDSVTFSGSKFEATVLIAPFKADKKRNIGKPLEK